jgi:hypothetical protein
MISFLEQAKDISYHVLWVVPIPATSSTRTHAIKSSLHNAGVAEHQEINHSEDTNFKPARETASMTCSNPLVSPNARVMIACALCL